MSLYDPTLNGHLRSIEDYLPTCLPQKDGLRDVVCEAMAYACAAGGKRIRPVLTLEWCRLCGGDPAAALPFAAAVELIHSYSLIHDDLPCMDDSPIRRGKPSVHAAFGEDMALLAGDALLNRAFEVMLTSPGDPARTLAAARVLADRAGIAGMVGGQVIDLQSEDKTIDLPTLQALQEGKTAALIRAACQMGAILGGGSVRQIAAADAFGLKLGLGFQIVDDILDVTVTQSELGKPVGADAARQKNTCVSLLGLENARRLAGEYTDGALAALADFGADADGLRELARALLTRSH
ncbi:MAG: polyprenyl synthetase family protein [Acutalibacteraceae bacterium]|jgi:geranylgeranyl diphosphate synthase type II